MPAVGTQGKSGGVGAGSRPTSYPWDVAILTGFGAPATTNNRIKLWTWTTRELGQYAGTGGWDFSVNRPRWNWFDSTLPWNNSSNCGSCQQQSVQRYASPADGVAATVYTFTHSSPSYGYDAIIKNLQQDASFQSFGQALANSCIGGCGWGGYPNWNGTMITSDPSNATSTSLPTNAAQNLSTADVQAAQQAASCDSGKDAINLPLGIHLLNQCELKALKGGILVAVGALGMMVGSVLLFKALGLRPPPVLGKVATVGAIVAAPEIAGPVAAADKVGTPRKSTRSETRRDNVIAPTPESRQPKRGSAIKTAEKAQPPRSETYPVRKREPTRARRVREQTGEEPFEGLEAA